MKKLHFINGSLMRALLAGGRIVAQHTDGYDYHIVVHFDDKSRKPYELHATQNYEAGHNVFGLVEQSEENGAIFKRAVSDKVSHESLFKVRYARTGNVCPDNVEAEPEPSKPAEPAATNQTGASPGPVAPSLEEVIN